MAYNINLSNGSALITGGLSDGTIDTTNSSLTLVGKNYPGYGTFLNQNFVQLLENFAKGSAPTAPLPGQLWWDSNVKYLKVNTANSKGTANQAWKTIATMTSSSSGPSNPVTGEQWWDTINSQLKVYNGSAWTIVGPAAAASTGNTGAIPDTIVAISPAATYVVLKFFIDNTLVGIWSKENSFTTGISGFGTINRGLNLSGAISQAYYGDADVAKNLKIVGVSIPAANFVRNDDPSDINASASREINGLVKIKEDSGLRIGEDDDLQVIVSGPEVFVRNATNNGNLVLSVVKNSVQTDFLKGNAISGLPEAYASPTASSNQYSLATKDYVDTVLGGGTGTSTFAANIVPSANLTYNLGSVSSWWNNIYGTAIHAQYADLAERFHADDVYDPGTIVGLGGEKEITIVNEELSEDVFGVISTRAAYLMNSGAGPDNSHPPVAVQGRVPVKVIGKIKKGERLVSAGNGLARAGAKNEISPWNVIGRSLEDKNTPDEGYVEAIVKLNS